MNDEELTRYDEAMRQGHYLTGLDIVLKAQAREEGRGTSDEEVYKSIMDNIFWREVELMPGQRGVGDERRV